MRHLFVVLGCFFVGLGVLGIALPLLPTTPFLLLAAACYAKGSSRFYDWLLHHKWFGSYIQNYRSGAGMTAKAKVSTLGTLWSMILISLFFIIHIFWAQLILGLVAIGVTIYLLSLPTASSSAEVIINKKRKADLSLK